MRAHVTYVVGITTFMATNANMERVQANMRAVNSNINILINRDGGWAQVGTEFDKSKVNWPVDL